MSLVAVEQISADLKERLRRTREQILERNVDINKIPIDELVVLCRYFSTGFTVAFFGGSEQAIRLKVNKYIKEQDGIKEKDEFKHDYVKEKPSGIGGWRYAHRLSNKVHRALEEIINLGSAGTGQQIVHASKTLLAETNKTKDSAVELMEAYEKQLLILAEHVVERFLPAIGKLLRKELRDHRDEIINKVKKAKPEELFSVFLSELERFIRVWSLKKFELLFAESMAENDEVSQAFDFSKEIIETFKDEKYITLESEETLLIKKTRQIMQKT